MKPNKFCILLAFAAASLFFAGCIDEPEFKPVDMGVNIETLDFGVDGGEATVKLYSNRDWYTEIVSEEETATWLTLSDNTGAAMTDSLTITISVLPNPDEDRQATINFHTETIYASVRVSQTGAIQKEYTPISDVRAIYKGADTVITQDYTIRGSVISNYMNSDYGGLNNATSTKTVVISDGTSGISLYLTANNTLYSVGDQIAVKVQGLTLQRYNNGSLQINAVPLDVIEKVGEAVLEPVSITAAQLVSGNYESMYVQVPDVQILSTDMGKKFVESEKHTSINFISKTGEKFVLFSSSYSTFGEEAVPTGSGTLKGVAMVYGTTYQMSITSITDYAALTGERFTETGGGGGGSEGGAVIGDYAKWNAITPVAAFMDDFRSVSAGNAAYNNDNWMFYTNDAASVSTGWKTGTFNNTETDTTDRYIQIAPYASTLDEVVAYALIPKVNVSTASPKTLKFSYTIYYQTEDASKFEVVTSKDFTGDFEKATWTVLQDVTFAAGTTVNVWVDKSIDLTSLAAETSLAVAFRYKGKSNTYRLDNVQIANGEYTPNPGEGEGGGDDPGEGGGAGDGVYTSNVSMPASDFSDSENKAYGGTVTVGSDSYPELKLGTSSVAGTYTFAAPLPALGTCTFSFYGVGWYNAAATLTVTINNAGKIDGQTSKTFSLTTNSGATGNPPHTITFSNNDFFTASLTEVTSATTITVTTSGSTGLRCILTGINVKAASN